MRGGDTPIGVISDTAYGPSPRARGRLTKAKNWKHENRSIPACAGETSKRSRLFISSKVHPRVRGGDTGRLKRKIQALGPSPRARGRHLFITTTVLVKRSIPACAGETLGNEMSYEAFAVHPRVRGGDAGRPNAAISSTGPSPRARGRRPDPGGEGQQRGSIPACAGETPSGTRICPHVGVHPRVRGGDYQKTDRDASVSGPSPRARGRHHHRRPQSPDHRSIPACAGETIKFGVVPIFRWVHPRVRGGDHKALLMMRVPEGPSPRARGRRPEELYLAAGQGSIPACAGETQSAPDVVPLHRVHPRVRGGDLMRGSMKDRAEGPSPRARGRPTTTTSTEGGRRSIPACAGETATDGSIRSESRVHPRVRGGDRPVLSESVEEEGPSPRARGRP